MKIASLSNNYNINSNRNQNFQGLWGKTQKNSDMDPGMCVFKHETTYYYYPFLDEKKADLDRMVEEGNHSRMDKKNNWYEKQVFKLCATLPFTEADFKAYTAAQEYKGPEDEKTRIVHRNVLDKYINKDPNNQTEAKNPKISIPSYYC